MAKKPILNPNLKGFYETKGKRYFVLYGGRGSSKTYHTAGFLVYLSRTVKARFLCVRQFQSRISDSVKTVIEEMIDNVGVRDEYRITDTEIEHKVTGSKFSFLGIQRNLREIKGIAGVDMLWIEEAEDLTQEQFEVIAPTIRSDNSKIIIVFNPRFATDWIYKNFITNPPPSALVRKINYDENPFVSQTMLDEIEEMKVNDYERYQHIYLGEPDNNDDQAVIKRSHILAAIDGHKKLGIEPSGIKRIGFDVADSGEDACATILSHGNVAIGCDLWKAKEDELLKSCTRVFHSAVEHDAKIIYDAIGVGAMAGAQFNVLNSNKYMIRHEKFLAGGAVVKPDYLYAGTRVKNKDYFKNVKSQAWWLISDRFRNTYNAVVNGQKFDPDDLIFIDSSMPHLQSLVDELSIPRRDFGHDGKVKVESKEDLKKRDIKSPNLADAFIKEMLPKEFNRGGSFA